MLVQTGITEFAIERLNKGILGGLAGLDEIAHSDFFRCRPYHVVDNTSSDICLPKENSATKHFKRVFTASSCLEHLVFGDGHTTTFDLPLVDILL